MTLIIVRGSNEAAGTGMSASGYAYASGGVGALSRLVSTIEADPQVPVYTESIIYPASIVPTTEDPIYTASRDVGVANLTAEMNDLAATCPATNMWLAGYSQGADVIGRTLSSPNAVSLSQRAKMLFNGAVFFGDPTYHPGELINAAPNTQSGLTSVTREVGSLDSWTGTSPVLGEIPKIQSFCYELDIVCQGPGLNHDIDSHGVYFSAGESTYSTTAAAFLKQFIISPQRLAPSVVN